MTGERKTELDKEALLPCPFCGGEADYEQVAGPTVNGSSWSVGCVNTDIDCIGYMMLASFTRKCEAAAAWNRRALPQSALSSRLVDRLLERAESYDQAGPSAQHTAALLREAAAALGGIPEGWPTWPVGCVICGQVITDNFAHAHHDLEPAAPPLTPGEQK